MTEPVKLTNRDLQRMYGALAVLGSRRMANIGAELKVARLLRLLVPLVAPIEELKRKALIALIDEMDEGVELTPTQEQIIVMRRDQAWAETDATPVEVDLPLQFALKEADMPKELAGKEGAANATGLGMVIADLGPLFLLDEPDGKCPFCGKAIE